MRFLITLSIAFASTNGSAVACPLDDVVKLCVGSGASASELENGVKKGDWTVEVLSAPSESLPTTGSAVYTMPSGREFFIGYRDFKDFSYSHCELNFVMALAKVGEQGMICTTDEFMAFEIALSQGSENTVTKEIRTSGTAFLVERPNNTWMAVILATTMGQQKPFNVWVETSSVKR
ncbi:hypothetical protein G6L13_14835 [Agrobacterium tumefaciens]|uniref:hypothetical protein n=1 Tax=Agrobacterium tumefaciens TaxID=358 RepID=UPI0015727090|nr:hypothetical protein [Agrobacterium tumefaciens]NTA81761.1 hypothetical protein [Agrobacterium tumefaciens]